MVFWKKEGLPRSLGRILTLEGIPHFVFAPGVDTYNMRLILSDWGGFQVWDPGGVCFCVEK